MTQDQIKWLTDPKAELQKHPPGTLIIIEDKSGVVGLARTVKDKSKKGDFRYECLPGFGMKTIEGALERRARFALV